MEVYRGGSLRPEDHLALLRHLINPMLLWTLERGGSGVLTQELASALVSHVFQTSDDTRPGEQLHKELVVLAALLVERAHSLFQGHRKEMIHFGWWTLKYDSVAKPYAFLFLAHFLRVFPTPEKIVLQARKRGKGGLHAGKGGVARRGMA